RARKDREERVRAVAVPLLAGEGEEAQEVHRRDGVGRGGGGVVALARGEDQSVVLALRERVAARRVEEALVEGFLQLERRAEGVRLERPLREVERRLYVML